MCLWAECSEAGSSCSHSDHCCSSARCLLQQEPGGSPAAGPELQGKPVLLSNKPISCAMFSTSKMTACMNCRAKKIMQQRGYNVMLRISSRQHANVEMKDLRNAFKYYFFLSHVHTEMIFFSLWVQRSPFVCCAC